MSEITPEDLTFNFIGHLADTATNIRHGKGGSKILIEVPENQLHEIINLAFLQGQVLKVTIEPHQEETESHNVMTYPQTG